MTSFVQLVLGSFFGTVLALVAYLVVTGKQYAVRQAIVDLLAFESYGTYSPKDRKMVNDPEDSRYEYPMQRNNARRPARSNNRIYDQAMYPASGPPTAHLAGMPGAALGTASPQFAATGFDEGIWDDPQPANVAFGSRLLDDLTPNPSIMPVRRVDQRSSRVPIDS